MFVFWNLLNTIVSIISAFLYAYMCAFGLKEGTFLFYVDSIFEIIFISDSLLQFVVEYHDEKTRKPVKNLQKIALNYFKGRLMFDAVTIIPFVRIFEALTLKNLFYAVKVLRIKKGLYLLDTSKFKQSIKRSYEENLRKKIV